MIKDVEKYFWGMVDKNLPKTTDNEICRICQEHQYAKNYNGCCAHEYGVPSAGCSIYEDICGTETKEYRKKLQRMREEAEEKIKDEKAKEEELLRKKEAEKAKEEEITKEGLRLQEEYCKANKLPMFVPPSGKCFHCHKPVFGEGGYSLEIAATELITACHRCCQTFCD